MQHEVSDLLYTTGEMFYSTKTQSKLPTFILALLCIYFSIYIYTLG